MDVAVHINPALAHQVEHGEWFRKGFQQLGVKANITSTVGAYADIHVISGENYAYNEWQHHPKVLYLSRAYYQPDPEWVSLGWMDVWGGRRFKIGKGRKKPEVKKCPTSGKWIFLADCNQEPDGEYDHVRRHPHNEQHMQPLSEVLKHFGTAVGYRTTALVLAGLYGLRIICKDRRNIMYRPDWLEVLPYADWHYSEIESGEALDYLLEV